MKRYKWFEFKLAKVNVTFRLSVVDGWNTQIAFEFFPKDWCIICVNILGTGCTLNINW